MGLVCSHEYDLLRFYKAVVAITGGASTKHFAELTKAWICDKDISEGKMWHYYVYIMCDDEDNDYKAYEHMSHDREYDSDYKYGRERRSSGRMSYPYSRYEIQVMVMDMATVIAVALNKKGGYYVSFHV